MSNNRTLLFGYGNPDRGDDGAAFHIFSHLFQNANIDDEEIFSADVVALDRRTDVLFNFQLLPEYSETIAQYDRVIFIDAHTAEIEEELKLQSLAPDFKYSPFTHHFSPSSCLAVARELVGDSPEAWLLSIRGYHFGFDRSLSKKTSLLVDQAIELLQSHFLE